MSGELALEIRGAKFSVLYDRLSILHVIHGTEIGINKYVGYLFGPMVRFEVLPFI